MGKSQRMSVERNGLVPTPPKNGHLEVLQWARANECSWNASTCANAARKGHLEVLQWARTNGCPWNEMDLYLRRQEWAFGGVAVGKN